MRALVTGASGFIGSHLIQSLTKRNMDVIALSRRALSDAGPRVRWVYADLSDIEKLHDVLGNLDPCEYVFHFGAQMYNPSNGNDVSSYLNANVHATSLLLDQAVFWSSRSFVYASGTGIIGKPVHIPVDEEHPLHPVTSYHLTKAMGETLCQFHNRLGAIATISLRITSPFGPGMSTSSVLSRFVDLARNDKPIMLFGSGGRTQNFVYVQDVVDIAVESAIKRAKGVFNIGASRDVSMCELADAVIGAFPGCRSIVQYAGIDDPQEGFRWCVDIGKAGRELDYHPVFDLQSGLKSMLSSTKEKIT